MNFFSILKNKTFRTIAVYNRRTILWILFLALISVMIYTAFPLITQFYMLTVYASTVSFLVWTTGLFCILFIIKWIIDMIVQKYEIKYFLKLEKNIKEKIIQIYGHRPDKLLYRNAELYTKHTSQYINLIRTVYDTWINIAKILVVVIIIWCFDKNLFLYIIYCIPVFMLFYLIGKKIAAQEKDHTELHMESDFGVMLQKSLRMKTSAKYRAKFFARSLDENMKRKIANRSKHVFLSITMSSFISFFRLFYLAYFGYFVITSGMYIHTLIVGLLYLTLLFRPCVHLLESVKFYTIYEKSFKQINRLYELKPRVETTPIVTPATPVAPQ